MKNLGIYLVLFIACGCTVNNKLDQALRLAANNRPELEKVLHHYEGDSLKYEAASFLIENMPYHYYYEGETLKDYKKFYQVFSLGKQSVNQVVDSLIKNGVNFSASMLQLQADITTIDSAYLVHNIDWAFKVWEEQPWGKHVSFENFCEYVLPYRTGNEPLSEWREEIYKKYNPLLDSIRYLPEAEDPCFAAQVLLDSLTKYPMAFTGLLPAGPSVGPEIVEWKVGNCRDLADVLTYVGRALGIPCGSDYMTMRGDGNDPHSWSFVLDKKGNTYITHLPDSKLRRAVEYTDPRLKVWRSTFGLNETLWDEMKDTPNLYPIYRYPKMQDVTSVYADSLLIQLAIPRKELQGTVKKGERIYLCVSSREKWVPAVCQTHIDNDSVYFNDVDGNVVALLGTWDGEQVKALSDPFFIERRDGSLYYYHPEKEEEQVRLLFKFPLFHEYFLGRMEGGVIEGSDRADFLHADTLYMIREVPQRLCTTVHLSTDKAYRYVRYRGKEGSYSDIAELMLYEYATDSVPMKGRIIGTPGGFQEDGSHEYTNVFDNDPYTSFSYKEATGGWAGLDFGKPRTVKKLTYVPRNRDNFVRKGDRYELFYWKDLQWLSAGIQFATSDSLVYTVPKNALMILKDYTRGRDERIFEYTRGQAQWTR